MTLYHSRHALAGVCLIATAALLAAPVRAAPADYRFEVVQVQSAGSGKSNVTLRLLDTPDKNR